MELDGRETECSSWLVPHEKQETKEREDYDGYLP